MLGVRILLLTAGSVVALCALGSLAYVAVRAANLILLLLFVITGPPLLMLGLGFLKAARELYRKRPSE
jgi:hypothetical protein